MSKYLFAHDAEIKDAVDNDGFRFLPSHAPASFLCADCHKSHEINMTGMGGTGYAVTPGDLLLCYPCSAVRSENDMTRDGKATLYLSPDNSQTGIVIQRHKLTDWTGNFSIPIHRVYKSRHNWAGDRYDFWFRHAGHEWHGYVVGNNTQIAHCKRTKGK